MFVNGEHIITAKLENISLKETNMQPKSERPPICPKSQLPQLHLTPSGGGPKKPDGTQQNNNPCLLRPQHDIPPTPPPQTDPQPLQFFPQRIG